jgi:hypothetical protein
LGSILENPLPNLAEVHLAHYHLLDEKLYEEVDWFLRSNANRSPLCSHPTMADKIRRRPG